MTYPKDIPASTTLLELCRKNDPAAWDRLTKLYTKLVLYWLKECDVPAADSNNVCQEILSTLSSQFRSFRKGATGKFRSWLRKIVYSRAMEYHSSKKSNKKESLKSGSRPAGGKAKQEATDKKLDAAKITDEQDLQEQTILNLQIIEWLDGHCNPLHIKAFKLVTIDGMKSREVAEKFGTSPDNIRQISSRLRQRIHNQWDGLL